MNWGESRSELSGRSPSEYISEAYQYDTDLEISEFLTRRLGERVSQEAVTKKRQAMGLRKTATGLPVFNESEFIKYTDAPTWQIENSLHICDVHAPYHDAAWLGSVVALATEWDIGHIHCAGDLFDFNAVSLWAKKLARESGGGKDEVDVELSDEIEEVVKITDVLLRCFDGVHLTVGNHEGRMSRIMGAALRVKLLKQLLGYRTEERFHVYPYAYAHVVNSMGKTRISHPKNSSVVPTRVAARMADKYRCHYACAHGHDWGETTSASGYWAASLGCCADPARIAYVSLVDNLRPLMQQGALIFKNGLPVLLHPKYNPPERYLTKKILEVSHGSSNSSSKHSRDTCQCDAGNCTRPKRKMGDMEMETDDNVRPVRGGERADLGPYVFRRHGLIP